MSGRSAYAAYRAGDFQYCSIESMPDGTVRVEIYRPGWRRPYSFRCKDGLLREQDLVEDELIEE